MAGENEIPQEPVRLSGAGRSAGTDIVDSNDFKVAAPPQTSPISPQLAKYMQQNMGIQTTDFKQPSTQSIKDSLLDAQVNGISSHVDPFKMSKQVMGDFRNPNLQNQYYQRYAEHNQFDKLGFNPFRDNESLYNEHTSNWDEMSRAAGEWATLAGLGFKDAMGFGDLSDQAVAAQYEEAMAIGSSSIGGAGGFTTNLFLNSGYTVGIMGELAMEEIGMGLAEVGLGIAAVPTAGSTVAGNIAVGVAMASRATRAFGKIKTAWKAATNISKTLGNLKDINKARSYFNKAIKGTANFINPLENTVDFLKNVNKVDDLKNLNSLGKTVKGFGEFYRDVRNIRLAYGEGALEGGMVQNKMERDLLQDFQVEHGRMPDREEGAIMRETAKRAGVSTSYINAPVIFLSNKMTFDGLVRGRFKNLSSNTFITRAGKVTFDPKRGLKDAYKALPQNFFKAKLEYLKNPRLMLGLGLVYGKANIAEGLQELAQETIAGTQEDYYTAKFNGDASRGGYYNFLASNLNKQVSAQGFETFMSGFLMGGMISPISNAISATVQGKQTATNLKNKFGFGTKEEKLAYVKTKADKETQLDYDVNMLNEFYEKPENYFSPDLINMMEQKEFAKAMKHAQETGDMKSFYDMKDTSGLKHVMTALRYGRLDTHLERLSDFKNLSEEEIMEMHPDLEDASQFYEAINIAAIRAKKIESRWKYANENFQNPFPNPQNHLETMQSLAWNQAIEELIFNQYSFDRALERQQSILDKAKNVVGLSDAAYTDFNILFNLADSQNEINTLKTELKALREVEILDPETKKFKKEKEARLKKLTAFTDAMTEAKSNIKVDESLNENDFIKVKETYIDYIDHIATKHGDFTTNSKINDSLDEIIQHHLLGERAKAANNAVNTLLDPKTFAGLSNRILEINEQLHNNKKTEIRKSLEEFEKVRKKNKMLNDLYELGIFFDPAHLEALENEGKFPEVFHYVDDAKIEIPVISEDYNKAVAIIKSYVEDVTDLTIPEMELERHYDSKSRLKKDGDKRTYTDYAEQYEFDSSASSTEVPLKQVLEIIIKSEHATDREIALAQQYLKIADDKEKITFVNNQKTSGLYSKSKQTIIDARYNSHEYKQGRGASPIEFTILHEETHRRTVENLETDSEYRTKMTSLMGETQEAFKAMDPVDAAMWTDRGIPFYGLKNVEEFVAEAMSNEHFQRFLSTVETKVENTSGSLWKKFVNLVMDNIQSVLGKGANGTVLNAVLDIMTTKISQTYDIEIYEEAPLSTRTTLGAVVSNKMRISEVMDQHPSLLKEIVGIFREDNANLEDPLLPGAENMTNTEIVRSPVFMGYFKDPHRSAKERAIRKYNKGISEAPSTIITTGPVTENEFKIFTDTGTVTQTRVVDIAKKLSLGEDLNEREQAMRIETHDRIETLLISKKAIPVTIFTAEMRIALKRLGYSPKQIKVFKARPAEAQKIINEDIDLAERNTQIAVAKLDPLLAEKVKYIHDQIQFKIDSINNYEEFKAIEGDLLSEFSSNPEWRKFGLTGLELNRILSQKLEQLAKDINFDDIEVGEVLILNYKSLPQAIVNVKRRDSMDIEFLGGDQKVITIKKKDMSKYVKFKDSPALQDYRVDVKDIDEITEKDKELAEGTLVENAKLNSAEIIKEDISKVKGKKITDLSNSLIDSICK